MKLSFVCLSKVNVVFKQLSIFRRKPALLWKWFKSIWHRRENGVDTLKLHHDTLSKTLKRTLLWVWLKLQVIIICYILDYGLRWRNCPDKFHY